MQQLFVDDYIYVFYREKNHFLGIIINSFQALTYKFKVQFISLIKVSSDEIFKIIIRCNLITSVEKKYF